MAAVIIVLLIQEGAIELNGTCAIWDGDAGILLADFQKMSSISLITPPFLFTIDRFGAWSTSGCREVIQDENHTVCECNQLGHFGILFVREYSYSLYIVMHGSILCYFRT